MSSPTKLSSPSLTGANVRHQTRSYLASGLAILLAIAFVTVFIGGSATLVTVISNGVRSSYGNVDAVISAGGPRAAEIAEKQLYVRRAAPAPQVPGRISEVEDLRPAISVLLPEPFLQTEITTGKAPEVTQMAVSQRVLDNSKKQVGDTLTLCDWGQTTCATLQISGVVEEKGVLSMYEAYLSPEGFAHNFPQIYNSAPVFVSGSGTTAPSALPTTPTPPAPSWAEKLGSTLGFASTVAFAPTGELPLAGEFALADQLAGELNRGFSASAGTPTAASPQFQPVYSADSEPDKTTEAGAPIIPILPSALVVKAQLDQATQGSQGLLGIAAAFPALALVVSAVVISTTFRVLGTRRQKELALLRCVGATVGQTRRLIVFESLLVGVISSLLGLLLGSGLTALLAWILGLIPPISQLFSLLTPTMAATIVALGTLVTLLAGLRPALQGAKIPPLTALRPREVATDTRLPWLWLSSGVILGALGATGVVWGLRRDTFVTSLGGIVMLWIGALMLLAVVLPRLCYLVLRAFRKLPSAELAAGNLWRSRPRTATTGLALMVGASVVSIMITGAHSLEATLVNHVNASGAGQEQEEMFTSVLNVMLNITLGLLAIAVIVSLIGVGNTLALSVAERRRELALLRALGMTRAGIRRLVAAEAAALGLVSCLLGVGLGVALGWLGLRILPLEVDVTYLYVLPWQNAVVLGAGTVAAIIAAWLPARSGSKVAPVSALVD